MECRNCLFALPCLMGRLGREVVTGDHVITLCPACNCLYFPVDMCSEKDARNSCIPHVYFVRFECEQRPLLGAYKKAFASKEKQEYGFMTGDRVEPYAYGHVYGFTDPGPGKQGEFRIVRCPKCVTMIPPEWWYMSLKIFLLDDEDERKAFCALW